MTNPTISVHLKGTAGYLDDARKLVNYNAYQHTLNATWNGFAEKVTAPFDYTFKGFDCWVKVNSSAHDVLQGYLYDNNWNILETSADSYDADTLVDNTWTKLTFNFDTDISEGSAFAFGCKRLGSGGEWYINYDMPATVIDYSWLYMIATSTWIPFVTKVLACTFWWESTIDIDLSDDIKEVNLDIGKNDIGGGYKAGSCTLTINNNSDKYFPNNTDSELWPFFSIGMPIEVGVVYGGNTYPQFTGFIGKITPPLSVKGRDVCVNCVDIFDKIKAQKISLGTVTGKTASEIVELVLEAAGVTSYDIMPDSAVLATQVLDDVNALDVLKDIVEVGQHYHYVDPNGVYVFRTNQWLASGNPLMTFALNSPVDLCNDAKDEYDGGTIKNNIRVKYPTDLWTIIPSPGSILQYGQRDYEVSNDFMPDLAYANIIGYYILEKSSRPNSNMTLALNPSLELIEVFLGSVIRVTHTESKLDKLLVIAGITRRIQKAGIVLTSLRCESYIKPPYLNTSFYEFEPMTTKSVVITDYDQHGKTAGTRYQTFTITTAGNLHQAVVKIKARNHSITPEQKFWIYGQLFLADVNNLPTGVSLAESDQTEFKGAIDGEEVTMTFPLYALTPGTKYLLKVIMFSGLFTTINYFYLYGAGTNANSNGVPGAYDNGDSPVVIANKDHWFRLRIET